MTKKKSWGLCKDCEWWQIEPGATSKDLTLGQCIEDDLQEFQLRVSGNSGCNHFKPGEPARAAGASEAPPSAAPTK